MLKEGLLIALVGAGLVACEKKAETPPSPSQTSAVGAAQKDHAEAVAEKAKADTAVDRAKDKQDMAEKRVDATKDEAKDTAKNVADQNKDTDKTASKDWSGPDKGWAKDFATFARGSEQTVDKGDYTLEREKDGSIAAYRKTQRVSGGTAADFKDSTLAAEVGKRMKDASGDELHNLTIDAKEHTVTLRGAVKDADQAGDAVRTALGTPGAERVISHLTWNK